MEGSQPEERIVPEAEIHSRKEIGGELVKLYEQIGSEHVSLEKLQQQIEFVGDIKDLAIFSKNVSDHTVLRDVLRENPELFNTLFSKTSNVVIEDKRIMAVLVNTARERSREIHKNEEGVYKRMLKNPEASEEEYRLGRYREQIESQVRDAVFKLLEKGYTPFESGFDELHDASQYIGMSLDSLTESDISALKKSLEGKFKGLSNISVTNEGGRLSICLYPENKLMTLFGWKIVWDTVSDSIPEIKERQNTTLNIDNGRQGKTFREVQDKIRARKNVWLSTEANFNDELYTLDGKHVYNGLALVDGKTIRMAREDFLKIDTS